MSRSKSKKAGEPKASLRERAYAEIKSRILEARYEPDELLSENRLADELKISRTPIREALRDLATAGLVRVLPQRGVAVSQFTPQDVVEVYQLREELEGFAARLAAERGGPADAKGFAADHGRAVEALEAGKLRQAYDHSVLLHSRVIAMARNARLARFMRQLDDQVHRFGLLTLRNGRAGPAIVEHGAIIEALAAHDGARTEVLMRAHLRADRDMVLRLLLPVGLTDHEAVRATISV